ncbi:hypothetical protein FQB35_08055 [Crassaminicella thermophila]|uniref:Uncharacterized protein n=1 Tax=Crassaminicella thermophila TaxID=2599308 RepID=A0A5C0SEG7_CRATE|nr:hypothetical protein [Crassaminicella thermophila]QEK12332.1 hypothetical protein FQB35_08055 [Crassaminicella thermophila]
MSFANQRNILIHDQLGNLYNFRWNDGKIIFTYFDKYLKKFDEDILVEDCTLEFDAGIDEQDQVYFVYQREDGKMVLMSCMNGFWHKNLLGGSNILKIFNLNMVVHNQKVHIIYCVPANENDMVYRIYHHYYDEQEWKSIVLQDIQRKNLLNPFQIIKNGNKLIIGFYDLINDQEQIYIKEFDTKNIQWEDTIQLTLSSSNKLYLDIFMENSQIIHLTYSEYFEGNLVIKYEKYKLENNKAIKILEKILSNPSNCSYPTFIKCKDKLWNVWTEYDQIVSSFTIDDGLNWNGPYLWKKSKEENFFRYKFITNDENVNMNYQFNHAFGKGYPEFSLIGFGMLEEAVKIPLKSIKKKEEEYIVEVKEASENKTNNEEVYLREIERLQENIKNLEERVSNIEEYLKRRRRGILFPIKK